MVAIKNAGEGTGERINLEVHKEWMSDSEHLKQY